MAEEKKIKNPPDTEKKKLEAKADKKASKKESKDPEKKEKKKNPFVRMAKGTKGFFKNFKGDIKKIVWPDSKTVLKNTAVVLVIVLAVGVVIFGFDFVLTKILDAVKNLASSKAAISPFFLV